MLASGVVRNKLKCVKRLAKACIEARRVKACSVLRRVTHCVKYNAEREKKKMGKKKVSTQFVKFFMKYSVLITLHNNKV